MNEVSLPHGIMFHHFHDNKNHIKCQGSITSDEFSDLIDYYSKNHTILSADDFYSRLLKGKLHPEDACLTFDDGLKCQYDIALDVLEKKGLSAFWFIYSSPLDGVREKLEIYHHFRFSMFDDIDDYYESFFSTTKEMGFDIDTPLRGFDVDSYLSDSPFYTHNDRLFRYIRDCVLGQEKYYRVMDYMIENSEYDQKDCLLKLWMDSSSIVDLSNKGHIVGIHSHSHPTRIIEKGYDGQFFEYRHCKETLEKILNSPVFSSSYPCGQYDNYSIDILKQLGISVSFNAFMVNPKYNDFNFEIPRVDHANIMRNISD